LNAFTTNVRDDVTQRRNTATQEATADAKDGPGISLSDYLCQRDIEMLAWHLADGHSLSQIAAWLDVHRGTVKRRMERAIRTLANAGIPVASLARARVAVIPVSKLRLREGIGLGDI
jgi:DNA-binding NarL/FixJ family response regulator